MPSLVRIQPGPHMPLINPDKIGASLTKIFVVEIIVLTIVIIALMRL